MSDTEDVREMRNRLRAASAKVSGHGEHRARIDPSYCSRAGKLGAASRRRLIERGKQLEALEAEEKERKSDG